MNDVCIRRAEPEDASLLHAWRSEPSTRRYQPTAQLDVDTLRRQLADRQKTELSTTVVGKMQWMIQFEREPVSWISLDVTSREHGIASVGYTVGERFRGKRIAASALCKLIEIAFDPDLLALARLEANVAAGNVASRRVLETAGFRHEGTARGLLIIDGIRVDHERFGLLRTDPDRTSAADIQAQWVPVQFAGQRRTTRYMTAKPTEHLAVFQYDEIVDRPIPEAPQISPDGRNIAFTVTASGRKGDHPDRAIWFSRNREPARRFTGGEGNHQNPRWSPDGTRLLFVSNRKDADKGALYLLPVDGGEAQRLGELEGILSEPSWSPDGGLIAILCTDPETDEEKKRKEDKDDPIVYEEDVKRTRVWIVDPETGIARQLTYGNQSIWGYAWAPDGDRIVVVSTQLHVINEAIRQQSLWQLPVSGGLMTHVADVDGGIGSPVVREVDGKSVVAMRANRTWEDPASSIWIVPLDGRAAKNLTPDYPGTLTELVADPANRTGLIARFAEGFHQRLYRISAAGGQLEPITPKSLSHQGTISGGPTLSADGRSMAFVWEATDVPPEVFVADIGGECKALSMFGRSFAGRLYPGEKVKWTSTDGVPIEGILIKPTGFLEGKRVPLIVEIHGGPTWQWEDALMLGWHDWAQMLASRGYAVLLPNPRGSTGYGATFEKLLQNDVGGGEAQDVISGAQAMVDQGIADPDRLGIAGWSWGGYLTALAITQTTMFKAAMMGAGVANLISDHAAGDIPAANLAYYAEDPYTNWELYARASPVRFAANVTTPTLILHGDSDIRVHPAQGQELYRALKTVGVPTQFVRYPREGHGLRERAHHIDLMKRIVDWFGLYMPAEK